MVNLFMACIGVEIVFNSLKAYLDCLVCILLFALSVFEQIEHFTYLGLTGRVAEFFWQECDLSRH